MQQHEGEVAEQQAAKHPRGHAVAQLWQQGPEHQGAGQQHQQQAGHQVAEIEAALGQGLQDLAVLAALGSILEQQADAQLVAAVEGIIRCPQGAVEIQGAALLAAFLPLVHRLTQLIDALAPVVEQLDPHLVPLLQRLEQLPLAAHHQIEAAAVTLVEQAVAAEGGERLIGGPQDQRLGTAEPAAGVEHRQDERQQQQRDQQAKQQPGQTRWRGGAAAENGGIHSGLILGAGGVAAVRLHLF
ncbi:hypothetical protein D3C78_1303490 [compost metagenome]